MKNSFKLNSMYEEYYNLSSGIYIEHKEIKDEIIDKMLYSHKYSYIFHSEDFNTNKYKDKNLCFIKVENVSMDDIIKENIASLKGENFMIYLNKSSEMLADTYANKEFLYSKYTI